MNELETLIVLQARTALLICQTVDYVEVDADPMPTSTFDKKAVAAAIESIDLMLLSAGQP